MDCGGLVWNPRPKTPQHRTHAHISVFLSVSSMSNDGRPTRQPGECVRPRVCLDGRPALHDVMDVRWLVPPSPRLGPPCGGHSFARGGEAALRCAALRFASPSQAAHRHDDHFLRRHASRSKSLSQDPLHCFFPPPADAPQASLPARCDSGYSVRLEWSTEPTSTTLRCHLMAFASQ